MSPCRAPQPPRTVQQQHPTAAPCCCQLPVPTWCSPFRRGLPSVAPSAPQQSHHAGGARAEVTFLHMGSTPRCPSHGWVLSVQSWALPSLRGSRSKPQPQQQAPGSSEHHPSCESMTADTPDMLLFPHLLAGWANPNTFLFFFLKKQNNLKQAFRGCLRSEDSQQLLMKSSKQSACRSYNSKRLTVKKYSGAMKYTVHSITKNIDKSTCFKAVYSLTED